MPRLDSILAEKYTQLNVHVEKADILEKLRKDVLELFRKLGVKVKDEDGKDYDEPKVIGILQCCSDEESINGFREILGLPEAIAEDVENTNFVSPEQAYSTAVKLMESNALNKVVITSHYGNKQLQVVEMWADQNGTLNISVDIPAE